MVPGLTPWVKLSLLEAVTELKEEELGSVSEAVGIYALFLLGSEKVCLTCVVLEPTLARMREWVGEETVVQLGVRWIEPVVVKTRGLEKAAICLVGSEKAARCLTGSEKAAMCLVGSEKAAICLVGTVKAAICLVRTVKAAICLVGLQNAVMCLVGLEKAAT